MNTLNTFIAEVVEEVRHPMVRQCLQRAFDQSMPHLKTIESVFYHITGDQQSADSLNHFFHNWSMTNNSAIGLSGYCNRLTMRWRKHEQANADPQTNQRYLNVLSHLNRVTDEDLGATGGKLHYDLYYQMATAICASDQWLSRQYLLNEGMAFKQWKDRCMVKNSDLMMGFLVTLVHEVYTHGEVEFILPLFDQWLKNTQRQNGARRLSDKERQRCLLWIDVHTKGTERNHFNETLAALPDLLELLGATLDDYDLVDIFTHYLQQKASVMSSLGAQLIDEKSPNKNALGDEPRTEDLPELQRNSVNQKQPNIIAANA